MRNVAGDPRPHTAAIARSIFTIGGLLKGGAGLAYLRNWLDNVGPDSINQKALSVMVGAGWAFRPDERVGFQVFGEQHAGAIGDVQTADGLVENVMGNFWSLGAAVVIR